jgi:hypothetical protein
MRADHEHGTSVGATCPPVDPCVPKGAPVTLLDRWAAAGDRATTAVMRLVAGRAVKVLWLVTGSIVAVGMAAFGTVQAASVIAHEQETVVDDVPAAGLAGLIVENGAGSTRVVGVEGADTVTVQARVSDGLRPTRHSIGRRDGFLVVAASCPTIASHWCRVNYTIEVPADMRVDVSGQGRITVLDVAADVVVDAHDGAVVLERLAGDVRASARDGRVEATSLTSDSVVVDAADFGIDLAFATSPREVVARASYGDVDIVLPDGPADADIAYAVDGQASEGRTTAAIRQDPDSDRTITARADDGSVNVTYAPS